MSRRKKVRRLNESDIQRIVKRVLGEQRDMAQEMIDREKAYKMLSSEAQKMVNYMWESPGDSNWMDAVDITDSDGKTYYTIFTTDGSDGDSIEFNWKNNKIIMNIGGTSQSIPLNSNLNVFQETIKKLI